jgi:hypothetical protein
MSNDPSPVTLIHGLSEADAQTRLKTERCNELARPDQRTFFRIVFKVLRAPDRPCFPVHSSAEAYSKGRLRVGTRCYHLRPRVEAGMPEEEVRTLPFFSLVLTIVSLIFVNRSFSTSLVTTLLRLNSARGWEPLVVPTMLSLTFLWPFASGLFRFADASRSNIRRPPTEGASVSFLIASLWLGEPSRPIGLAHWSPCGGPPVALQVSLKWLHRCTRRSSSRFFRKNEMDRELRAA